MPRTCFDLNLLANIVGQFGHTFIKINANLQNEAYLLSEDVKYASHLFGVSCASKTIKSIDSIRSSEPNRSNQLNQQSD